MYYGTSFGMRKVGGDTPTAAAGMPGTGTPQNPIIPQSVIPPAQIQPIAPTEEAPEPANALHKALLKFSEDLGNLGKSGGSSGFDQNSRLGQTMVTSRGRQVPFHKLLGKG